MAEICEETVRNALRAVLDPELGRDLVSLGMVKEISVEGERVAVTIELTTPACPLRHQIKQEVEEAIRGVGAKEVVVELSARVATGPGTERSRLLGVKHIIAVASGKGGVGKSTVAVNLALALHRHGSSVGLLDADVYGPSVPQMLGPPDVPTRPGSDDRMAPALHHGLRVVSVGYFIERTGAVMWRGPMVHRLLAQFVNDVDWGEIDYLVVDLPPGTGDAQLSLCQLIQVTGAVMVTTPQELALSDVLKGCAMFRKMNVPLLGVVENMSRYVCPACGHLEHIFAHGGGARLADDLGVPLLAEIPIDPVMGRGGDAGTPIVTAAPDSEGAKTFMKLAGAVAGRISQFVLSTARPGQGQPS